MQLPSGQELMDMKVGIILVMPIIIMPIVIIQIPIIPILIILIPTKPILLILILMKVQCVKYFTRFSYFTVISLT